jgi:hypothetical protein
VALFTGFEGGRAAMHNLMGRFDACGKSSRRGQLTFAWLHCYCQCCKPEAAAALVKSLGRLMSPGGAGGPVPQALP